MVDRHLEALDQGGREGRRRKRGLTYGADISVIWKREGGVAQRRKLKRGTYSDGGAKGAQAYRAGWVRRLPGRGSGLAWASWASSQGRFQNGN
jgi:hypothetical protein